MTEFGPGAGSCGLILGLCAACHSASAQTCTPYWAHPGGAIPPGWVLDSRSIGVLDDGSGPALYVLARSFVIAPFLKPFRWRDGSWTALPQTWFPHLGPVEQVVGSVILDAGEGPKFYLEGGSGIAGPGPVSRPIYWATYWNGSSWTLAPNGLYSYSVIPKTSIDLGEGPVIYGTVPPSINDHGGVYRWSGGAWQLIGDMGPGTRVWKMLGFDDGSGPAMYVIGNFVQVNGVPANRFAKWNGHEWSAAWSGVLIPDERGLEIVMDEGSAQAVFMLGSLNTIENGGILRFDGHTMSIIGRPNFTNPAFIANVNGMGSFDDGSGRALYAVGAFDHIDSTPINNIGRWDGHSWTNLGAGVGNNASGLIQMSGPRGPSLGVIGNGNFTSAGGGIVNSFAHWVGCPNCYANCDLSTRAPALNVDDFICFINKYAAKDPYANCTVDAVIDLQDFNCFVSKFTAGCP